MPIYEYCCESCDHRFDILQKITDDPVTVCPECGGSVTKQVSSTSFILKGSGWYVTDYARGGKSGGGEKPVAQKSEAGEKTTAADAAAA
ncbi:MAG: zinc ribbon domain-containing protein [Deltaproteobacteria bacterium]|nr:zinc ribbon domain-containing protein [Candidatus Anaeroferrophillacea bacterium]